MTNGQPENTTEHNPDDDIQTARQVISSGAGEPQTLLDLAGRLERHSQLTFARQVLVRAEEKHRTPDPLWFRISRKLALCTYKDQDEPLATRLDAAETRLRDLLHYPDLPDAERQDCLGILGGISKQRWRAFGNKLHLERALEWYAAGASMGLKLDSGYTALNAAFVLDALSDGERDTAGHLTDAGRQRRLEAADLRRRILDAVPAEPMTTWPDERQWWHYCTRGEAFLGLRQYPNAHRELARANALQIYNWQREAAARQLADLARLHRDGDQADVQQAAAFAAVAELLVGRVDERDATATAQAIARAQEAAELFVGGKVGLALSGGGFRASFFHIGVLARLAELDVLRHVEVLSCVSGGSIVGAYYYLKLQHALERADDALTREDYIQMVREVEQEFLDGVQRNVRNLMLFGFRSNLMVLTSTASSMTHRLGDLYERELYSRVKDGRQNGPRLLSDLRVAPGGNRKFNPRNQNWSRRCKVPMLVLNATTLNTCHNWQFTATFMGEPPTRSLNADINANDRLRRLWHGEAPLRHRETTRLGHAVAASACVPGLFDPLVLNELYEGGYVTRLVDGGVYDNQGLASLLEQDCTVLLISDASGQADKDLEPSDTRVGVLTRTQNVLMARVREAQYELLSTLSASSLVRGTLYLHLKKGLEARPVDWLNCPNPSKVTKPDPLTSYGMRRDVQGALASIRTDLDAFSFAEADALMLSGYRMATEQFTLCIRTIPVSSEPPVRWRFQGIEPIACSPVEERGLAELLRTLRVARRLALKPFALSRPLLWGAVVLSTAAVLALVLSVVATLPIQLAVTRTGLVVVLLVTVVLFAGARAAHWLDYPNRPWRVVLAVVMCLGGALIARVLARLTEPVYVRSGPVYDRRPYERGFPSEDPLNVRG